MNENMKRTNVIKFLSLNEKRFPGWSRLVYTVASVVPEISEQSGVTISYKIIVYGTEEYDDISASGQ